MPDDIYVWVQREDQEPDDLRLKRVTVPSSGSAGPIMFPYNNNLHHSIIISHCKNESKDGLRFLFAYYGNSLFHKSDGKYP